MNTLFHLHTHARAWATATLASTAHQHWFSLKSYRSSIHLCPPTVHNIYLVADRGTPYCQGGVVTDRCTMWPRRRSFHICAGSIQPGAAGEPPMRCPLHLFLPLRPLGRLTALFLLFLFFPPIVTFSLYVGTLVCWEKIAAFHDKLQSLYIDFLVGNCDFNSQPTEWDKHMQRPNKLYVALVEDVSLLQQSERKVKLCDVMVSPYCGSSLSFNLFLHL